MFHVLHQIIKLTLLNQKITWKLKYINRRHNRSWPYLIDMIKKHTSLPVNKLPQITKDVKLYSHMEWFFGLTWYRAWLSSCLAVCNCCSNAKLDSINPSYKLINMPIISGRLHIEANAKQTNFQIECFLSKSCAVKL